MCVDLLVVGCGSLVISCRAMGWVDVVLLVFGSGCVTVYVPVVSVRSFAHVCARSSARAR